MAVDYNYDLLPRLTIVQSLVRGAADINNPDTARLNARGSYVDGMADLILAAAGLGNEGYQLVKAAITREMPLEEFDQEIMNLMWQDFAIPEDSS